MASQSSNPPSQGNSHQPNEEDGSEPSSADKLVLEAPQPMREDYVQNAVKFLSHPKVKGSPVMYRRSFLEKKGLTKGEIDEAFRRVPDPQTNAPGVGAAGSQQVQPYNSVQSLQPSTGSVAAGPIVVSTQSKFSWYRTLLAVGLFLGFGAGGAVFIKKLFLPRLKSWIRKVVAEGDETEGKQLKSKIDEETAEAVRTSASAVSTIAKTNEELLASKDEEKKILMNLTQALDSQAKELKSLSESINNSRESMNNTSEDRFLQYRLLEGHAPSAQRNGSVNSSWKVPQQTSMYGVPNSDFGSGRSSFAPVPAEPTFSRSYVEQTMSTAQQRGDKSSGSKPWEMNQYSQQKLGFGSNSQLSDNGSNSEAQDNYGHPYHLNGDEPRPLSYSMGVEERPPQRRWVPPQPPGVIMPEAAAAIRQPKSLPKQPSGDDTSEATAAEMQANGAPPMQANVAEVRIDGSATTDAGHSEIEKRSEAI